MKTWLFPATICLYVQKWHETALRQIGDYMGGMPGRCGWSFPLGMGFPFLLNVIPFILICELGGCEGGCWIGVWGFGGSGCFGGAFLTGSASISLNYLCSYLISGYDSSCHSKARLFVVTTMTSTITFDIGRFNASRREFLQLNHFWLLGLLFLAEHLSTIILWEGETNDPWQTRHPESKLCWRHNKNSRRSAQRQLTEMSTALQYSSFTSWPWLPSWDSASTTETIPRSDKSLTTMENPVELETMLVSPSCSTPSPASLS